MEEEMVLLPDRGLVPRSRISDEDIGSMLVKCTVCCKQVFHQMMSHPYLNVLICKECAEFYGDGDFSQDELGDKYCRWCAQGGKLNVCDFCTNAFCNECIRRNLGRGEVGRIKGIKWHCYICSPEQLNGSVAYCRMIVDFNRKRKVSKNKRSINRDVINGQSRADNPEDGDVSSDNSTAPDSWTDVHFERSLRSLVSALRKIKKLRFKISRERQLPIKVLQGADKLERFLIKQREEMQVIINSLSVAIDAQAEKIQLAATQPTASLPEGTSSFSVVSESSGTNTDKQTHRVDPPEKVLPSNSNSTSEAEKNDSSIATDGCAVNGVEIEPDEQVSLPEESSVSVKVEKDDLPDLCDVGGDLSAIDFDDVLFNKDATIPLVDVAGSDDSFLTSPSLFNDSPFSEDDSTPKSSRKVKEKKSVKGGNSKKLSGIKKSKEKLDSVGCEKSSGDGDATKTSNVTDAEEKSSLSSMSNDEDESKKESVVATEEKSLGEKTDDVTTKGNLLSVEKASGTDKSDEGKTKADENRCKSREEDEDNQLAKQQLLADCMDSSDSEMKDFKGSRRNKLDSSSNSDSSLGDFDTSMSKRMRRNKLQKGKEEKVVDEFRLSQDTKIQGTISVVVEKLKDADLEGYLSGSMPLPDIEKKDNLDKEIDNLAKLPLPGKNKSPKKKVSNKKSPKKQSAARAALLLDSSSSSDDDSISLLPGSAAEQLEQEKKLESRNDAARNALLNNYNSSVSSPTLSDDNFDDGTEEDEKKSQKSKRKLFASESEESRSSGVFNKKKKKVDKLLRVPLKGPGEEKQKGKKKGESETRKPRRKRPAVEDSDGCVDLLSSDESDSSVMSASSSQDFQPTKGKKRKRIKTMKDSSSESDKGVGKKNKEENTPDTPSGKGRKNIRKLLDKTDLAAETKKATQAEKERRKRVLERQKMYNQVTEFEEGMSEARTRKLVLDIDKVSKEELVEVDQDLITKLKQHQVEGVKFMWECTVESVQQLKDKKNGSGCVLAHCMGLGKTLQVITYVHTLLTNGNVKPFLKTCLVVCPYNTVLNWASEFEHWLTDLEDGVEVFELANVKVNYLRADVLKNWQEAGGVLIMSYDMFRLLVSEKGKKIPKKLKEVFISTLLDPGPDIVVCDEGHILKNERTAISKAMSQIRSLRRIVLTGTPLQNNLQEYHCMVQFVKPHLLGQRKEFQNRFLNPITNGQCADSTPTDVKLMKKRVHILHKLLEGCVQRCDYSAVASFLPPKHEYVISVRLTEPQVKMYRYYLDTMTRGGDSLYRGTSLFKDFNKLRLIWTHPYMLHLDKLRIERKKLLTVQDTDNDDDANSMASFIDDRSSPSVSMSGTEADSQTEDEPKAGTSSKVALDEDEVINKWTTKTRGSDEKAKESEEEPEPEPEKDWWNEYVPAEELTKIELSGKIVLLMDILRQCEAVGDKILIFTQSLLTLNMIEEFLKVEDCKSEENPENLGEDSIGTWVQGVDYFRMDGSTSVDLRKRWIQIFNDPENIRARLFLISTKAGSLGTNLVGANRVVVMDASWNPTHDVQAIFRVYRFGQKKPVYIYRFLSQGTMEEKIYDRQVAKQSLACRVVDEQQIERHFNAADLQELYSFEPDSRSKRPTPLLPKDLLLADLISHHKDLIVSYHEHDSLLRKDAEEEDLNEEERKEAWAEYEAEKEGRNLYGAQNQTTNTTFIQGFDVHKMAEELRKKNPGATPVQIQEQLLLIISSLLRHKQVRYQQIYNVIQQLSANKQIIPAELKAQLGEAFRAMQNLVQLQNMLKLKETNQQQNQQQQPRFTTFQPRANEQNFIPGQGAPRFQYGRTNIPNPQYQERSYYLYRNPTPTTEPIVTHYQTPEKPTASAKPATGPIITEVDISTPSFGSSSSNSNVVITEVD